MINNKIKIAIKNKVKILIGDRIVKTILKKKMIIYNRIIIIKIIIHVRIINKIINKIYSIHNIEHIKIGIIKIMNKNH